MSEENKKTEKIEQPAELSEKELDNIAGGDAPVPNCMMCTPPRQSDQ